MSESKEAGPNRKLGRIEGKIGRGEKERERKREEKIVYIVPDGTDWLVTTTTTSTSRTTVAAAAAAAALAAEGPELLE